jgi:hypothetical protein
MTNAKDAEKNAEDAKGTLGDTASPAVSCFKKPLYFEASVVVCLEGKITVFVREQPASMLRMS